jgi:alpha-amylase/alpha-mannosidase (GH57 family)
MIVSPSLLIPNKPTISMERTMRLFVSLLNRRVAGLALTLCAVFSPVLAGDLYLNLVWHQHQPLYVNPQTDQLRGPWVRTHATKDYYDMAAMHENFPEVHATINLTSSLILQIQNYYVDRIGPFLYPAEDGHWAVHAGSFLARWKGKTDPWIDLALRPSSSFDSADVAKLIKEPWNAFGISPVQIARFPEYAALREKVDTAPLTTDEMTSVKAWFYLAHFDPDFLRGTSNLDVSMTDLLDERDGKFYLKHPLTERDANRLVADAVRVMEQVIPEHRKLMYDPHSGTGQLEIITTPFYHPILPLIIDTDVARQCQPHDSLPKRFAYPQDAHAQVVRGMRFFEKTFGSAPRGMWPAEGAVSDAAADVFAGAGVRWIASDMQVLARSTPPDLPLTAPYRLHTASGKYIALVFRETHLSDYIGFTYQNLEPDSAVIHFMAGLLQYRPKHDEPDRLLTVILDGENAWEWYTKDMDAKRFLKGLYTALTNARDNGDLTCVTPTEYFEGNPVRQIPSHPIPALPPIQKLWPGSWINANFDTWIGEPEENQAWDDLLRARQDLERSGLPQPDPAANPPTDEHALAVWHAYESLYAAEGSDWFWWYGADQTAPGGDLPFEDAFFSHLRSVYDWAGKAGASVKWPAFAPILSAAKIRQQMGGGVMAQGMNVMTRVKFVCDARRQDVPAAIYITGNLPELGDWRANVITMYDDGTHGDSLAHDGLWSLELDLALGTEVQYKYTNSGAPGVWVPSEEFPFRNRVFTVDGPVGGLLIRRDIFGQE